MGSSVRAAVPGAGAVTFVVIVDFLGFLSRAVLTAASRSRIAHNTSRPLHLRGGGERNQPRMTRDFTTEDTEGHGGRGRSGRREIEPRRTQAQRENDENQHRGTEEREAHRGGGRGGRKESRKGMVQSGTCWARRAVGAGVALCRVAGEE